MTQGETRLDDHCLVAAPQAHQPVGLLEGGGATLKWFLGSGQLESATQSPQDSSEEALEYARRLYLNILEWYKIADSKGQLLLTLNGAFVTVMTGFVLGKPAEIRDKVQQFSLETWFLLVVAALAIALSIGCAAMCLWSRSGLGNGSIYRLIKQLGVDPKRRDTYAASVSWWFGTIALLDRQNISDTIKKANQEFERDALVSQIFALSVNVLKKHRWVNRGWVLTAISLGALVLMSASYLMRLL
jgi:hypothetical protein